ncbi:MAG TPA: branched-chain amino acid ABC transporter permease [Dehalococcoidia bacterium]|nr:branched-chain amino acid ABC transporter permease [Dehalococcoidia bacterium]
MLPGIEKFYEFLILAALVGVLIRYTPVLPARWRVPIAAIAVLVVICYMPFTVGTFRTSQLTTITIWSIVAIGLNVLTGYNGQISLGHGAFVLIGAYTTAVLTDTQNQLGFFDGAQWPFWTAMIMSGLVAAVAGVAVGVPSLRLTGPYLAVATLSLMIALPSVLEKYDSVTGGATGLRVPQPAVPGFLDGILERQEWFFFLAFTTAVIMAAIAWYIVRSRWGRAFVAIRDTEVAALAVGISVARYKVLAFTISAFFGGVAGSLVALASTGYVSPQTIGIVLSINYFTAIVIGGLGSIMGSIIGGFVVVLLPDLATDIGTVLFGEKRGERLWPTIYGSILIIVIIAMPYGVAGFLHRAAGAKPADIAGAISRTPQNALAYLADTRERLTWRWTEHDGKRGDAP